MKIPLASLTICAVSFSSIMGMSGEYHNAVGLNIGSNDTSADYSFGALIGFNSIYNAGNLGITAYNFLAVGENTIYYVDNSIIAGVGNSGEYHSSLTVGTYDGTLSYNSLVVGVANSANVENGLIAGTNNSITGINQFAIGQGLIDHVWSGGWWYTDGIPTVYLGQYNLSDQGGISAAPPLLVVGNGTSSNNRSNALEVLRNGDVQLRSGKLNLFSSGTATTPTIVLDPQASTIKINGNSVVTANTNGNVGFGTTSPSQPLTISNSASNKLMLTGGVSQNGMQFDSVSGANQFYLYTGAAFNGGGFGVYNAASGLQPFSILNNGNIGIGTTTPIASLDVNGRAIVRNNMKIFGSSESWAEGLTVIQPAGWGGIRLTRNDPATGTYHGNWAIGYTGYTGNDFSISNSANGVQHDGLIHISSSTQNVGVGSVAPSEKLTVVDSGDLNPDSGTFGVYAHNLTQGIAIGYSGITKVGSNSSGDLGINAKGAGNLIFQTVATGNVGIGTPSPISKLDVGGVISSNGVGATVAKLKSITSDGAYCIASGSRMSGTITLAYEGAHRSQRVVIALSGFHYNYAKVNILSNLAYGGIEVLSNFRVLKSGDGGALYLVVDVGNRNGDGGLSVVAQSPDVNGGMNVDIGSSIPTGTTDVTSLGWVMKANGSVGVAGDFYLIKRQGDIMMGEFGTLNSGD